VEAKTPPLPLRELRAAFVVLPYKTNSQNKYIIIIIIIIIINTEMAP
jgi:hypothetical protein